ncbi:class I SAM-dependent methyltransferase [Mycolicibacterium mucogenicum]|uniref:Class I SAM-dependent methyltransferase n=1 Tax=Mycolicibacterium mucogenicum DSM 44124 TaxID=1226753 RepID=A0A8H2PFC1_MYCMU|nr:class I SAM-dependent methyltransferase [Mycolicibacterium mucogenicum]KAB7751639.1 methyltransferase type 11 [Mycolicibacterium mucogenicum DSM 44124]QPG69705.1 class I SAM-dependent methyltransferase [Mycolicibacterium mucogenicum DSM 44124]
MITLIGRRGRLRSDSKGRADAERVAAGRLFRGRFKSAVRKAIVAYSLRNRRKKTDFILAFLAEHDVNDVLLVGATGDEHGQANSGVIESFIAARYLVKMGINIEPANTTYPFMIADARDMPFEANYVDFALANAIIEHVGHEPEQRRMVEEMSRVARTWIVTTPNKWFPVESHTSTLFLHWFPAWRRGRETDFTRLLSRREFRALLPDDAKISGSPFSPTFIACYAR